MGVVIVDVYVYGLLNGVVDFVVVNFGGVCVDLICIVGVVLLCLVIYLQVNIVVLFVNMVVKVNIIGVQLVWLFEQQWEVLNCMVKFNLVM